MAISISISNSEFKGKSKVLNNRQVRNSSQEVEVALDGVKVEDEVELLNDASVDGLLEAIEKAAEYLERDSKEKRLVKQMMREINTQNQSRKSILKKYVPELIVGTLANVIGTYISTL